MAADPAAFVDTNVLVYASQRSSRFHAHAVARLERARHDGEDLWISRQVLREYLATTTRPQPDQAPPLTAMQAIADVEGFERDFNLAEDGPEVFTTLLGLLRRFPTAGKQVHDANLVATMLVHGVGRLLTFNVADFRRFGAVIALEPVDTP